MTNSKGAFKKIAVAAARIGDAKKASPVAVYDLAGSSPLADYAVLMMVASAPQLDAVEEDILVKLKAEGIFCLNKDGMRSRSWKVLDYGGAIVHIYDEKAAGFYAMDKIYAGCKKVDWEEKQAPAPAKPAPRRAAPKKAAKKTARKAPKKK